MRILIVDDDAIVAEALAEALRADGYEVACHGDGHQALDVLDQAEQFAAADAGRPPGKPFGVILIDLNLPGLSGMELLRQLKNRPGSPVPIVLTSFGKIESAVEAMQLGATDYLTKPLDPQKLRTAVGNAAAQYTLTHAALTGPTDSAEDADRNGRHGLGNLIGADPGMQKVYELVEAVGPTRTTVLISGDSGTGKTMAARAIHRLSPRAQARPTQAHHPVGPCDPTGSNGSSAHPQRGRSKSSSHKSRHNGVSENGSAATNVNASGKQTGGPFVTFSCGAIPEALAESELFGHVRGAFTGADYDKPGKILAADGGTLFIDEINSASSALQMKLLRVLQERTFEPVGSTQTKTVDVRFVLASNVRLWDMVERGTFREDLYYRINVVNIHMPPLTHRRGDIAVLSGHFLERYCAELQRTRRLSDKAKAALDAYPWPGNVRELENVIERAVVLSRGPTIEVGDLPEAVAEAAGDSLRGRALSAHGVPDARISHGSVNGHHASPDEHVELIEPMVGIGGLTKTLDQALAKCERQILLTALEANAWNRQETSSQLDINRTTLYKKIKHHHLDEP